jgi:hypothetical protein
MEKIINQDIIDFRYKLIDLYCSDRYYFGPVCNDGSNEMTEEKMKVINDILVEFNNHFGLKNYDLG